MLTERLGGEATHRGLLGTNRARSVGLLIVGVAGLPVALAFQTPGIIAVLVAAGLVWVLTVATHRGSVLKRLRRRRWMKQLRKTGMDEYKPIGQRPADADEVPRTKTERREVMRRWNAYRDWPDGVEGMVWLRGAPGRPGIAWHTPTGEMPFLTVAFHCSGAVRGLESDTFLDQCSIAFGDMLAWIAKRSTLISMMQVITRAQPVDLARHEAWVEENFDENAPPELLNSYGNVVTRVGRGGLSQRHMAVIRWNLTSEFLAAAARRGDHQQGWILLMEEQITTASRMLTHGGLGTVVPMTAAQTLAMMRSQQVPSWPLDEASTVNAVGPWFESTNTMPYVEVRGQGPTGEVETWLHRTAVIPADRMMSTSRNALWLMPLINRMPDNVLRTVSLHYEGVPAGEALERARADVTDDQATIHAKHQRGEISDEEAKLRLAAAQKRLAELSSGTGIQGCGWALHVTVSTRSREDMRVATARVIEACEEMGAEPEWLNGYHNIAQAFTWPVCRGMRPMGRTAAGALMAALAGTGDKEDL